tara:strand:- start:204 stop:512 length:309 start_codon:yes stop_codon:yes gene_type:complete
LERYLQHLRAGEIECQIFVDPGTDQPVSEVLGIGLDVQQDDVRQEIGNVGRFDITARGQLFRVVFRELVMVAYLNDGGGERKAIVGRFWFRVVGILYHDAAA